MEYMKMHMFGRCIIYLDQTIANMKDLQFLVYGKGDFLYCNVHSILFWNSFTDF